jgi:hypothetical protein
MRFSNDIIELPKSNLPAAIKAEVLCNPEALQGLISAHTSSAVVQDLSNFARHLSGKAKSFLARLGLRRITASLFVSAATSEYWGFNGEGNLCRMVPEEISDGTIDAFDPHLHTDLASAYNMGRMEASLL